MWKANCIHTENKTVITTDIASETMGARKQWDPTINVPNDENYQSGISYPVKITFTHKGKMKAFSRLKKKKVCENPLPADLHYKKC